MNTAMNTMPMLLIDQSRAPQATAAVLGDICQIVWRRQNRLQKEPRGDTGRGGHQEEGRHHDLGPTLLCIDDAFLCHFDFSLIAVSRPLA
jgi:hypothetical protein